MNGAHLHLLLNHLPIVATYLSVAVLLGGYFLKNQTVKNTGLAMLIVGALLAIPAFLTGEPAEDILESAAQANKDFIETHEETAEWGIWVCEIAGVLGLIALIASVRQHKLTRTFTLLATIAALFASATWIKVGNTGGDIRHTEIRGTNAPAVNASDDDDEH